MGKLRIQYVVPLLMPYTPLDWDSRTLRQTSKNRAIRPHSKFPRGIRIRFLEEPRDPLLNKIEVFIKLNYYPAH